MKKYLYTLISALIIIGCSQDKLDNVNNLPVVHACMEGQPETRTHLDGLNVFWDEADQISFFYKNTGNNCYQLEGEGGYDIGYLQGCRDKYFR